ncbi:MAG: Maf family nucleotide pyrophosphatase [Pseudoxanthomonas sp.]
MLHLASRSPRRADLLARLGVDFATLELDVPEIRAPGEAAEDYVRRVAREKALAGLAACGDEPDTWVLGADTEVILDGEVFGKPTDAADARAMLTRLSGRTHRVVTAVCLASAAGVGEVQAVSEVDFAPLAPATVAAYVATGEPSGKAGAYAIQGGAERFVRRLAGSYSGVMGLPLFETAGLLEDAGIALGWGK